MVITSSLLKEHPDEITIIASTTSMQDVTGKFDAAAITRVRLRVPRVHAYFTGTGDLCASLILAWLHKHPHNLKLALELAINGLQAVLSDTIRHCGDEVARSTERSAEICKQRELRLIQNQDLLVDPPVVYHGEYV